MRTTIIVLGLAVAISFTAACDDSDEASQGAPDAAAHVTDAAVDTPDARAPFAPDCGSPSGDAGVGGPTVGDSGTITDASARDRCTAPLRCAPDGCPRYEPITSCSGHHLQVREGLCGGDGDLRMRISFDGGGEHIEYWDFETGELVAIDQGTDFGGYCDGTSDRILIGDLERVERCEATRGPQHIICEEDWGDAG